MNDITAIAGIKKKDERTVNEVIVTYSRLLWSIVSAVLKNIGTEQDVEECVADVFIDLWEDPGKFDPKRGTLKSWLCFRIIRKYKGGKLTMLINDFVNKFYLHDSLIDSVVYFEAEKEVRLQLDLAFWMQEWYSEDMPEAKAIAVVFHEVTSFQCPSNIQWDQISILHADSTGEALRLALMNDMTDEYLEIVITCQEITAEL